MIHLPASVRVYLCTSPCDMRKSFDTLAALVKQELGQNLLSGSLFLLTSKDRKRAKVLYFDGTGMCLFAKRLEKGRFSALWKQARQRQIELTLSELALFVEGSEALGRVTLSPPLMTKHDLRTKFPEKS